VGSLVSMVFIRVPLWKRSLGFLTWILALDLLLRCWWFHSLKKFVTRSLHCFHGFRKTQNNILKINSFLSWISRSDSLVKSAASFKIVLTFGLDFLVGGVTINSCLREDPASSSNSSCTPSMTMSSSMLSTTAPVKRCCVESYRWYQGLEWHSYLAYSCLTSLNDDNFISRYVQYLSR